MGAVRTGLRWAFRRIIAIYFREIEVIGHVPEPRTGGRIFAANHVNGLVDPVLVLTTADCAICPVAKSTLWKIPGLRWLLDAIDAVPIVRRKDDPDKPQSANDAIFERVASHLRDGGNILIFPEGTSHNEPQLAKLRSGAGRMLAAARAAGGRDLTFQAVGLEFDARDVFRSRALLVYGPVRSVDELAARGPDLPAQITDRLREDLSELLVLGSTWDERLLVARVAALFAADAGDTTLAGWNAIGRQVTEAKDALRATSMATYDAIAAAVTRYYAMLDAAGERDEEVAAGAPPPRRPLRILAFVAALPLAALGVVLYWLPYQLPRVAARLARGEADAVSTYKLGTGLVVFPLWACALIAIALSMWPPAIGLALAVAIIAAPFAALAFLDRSSLRARSRIAAGPSLDDLRRARRDLRAMLERTRSALAAPAPDP
jgi:1-acyl-sn-glycerol-3-phosphate acyltransferase